MRSSISPHPLEHSARAVVSCPSPLCGNSCHSRGPIGPIPVRLEKLEKACHHYLAAPPFPAYTSGHSTFSKASAQVLTHFYGTDAITFTATSDSLPGINRGFTSLAACADEIGMSRIYGGIHFQFDNYEGKLTGQRIGDYVSANFLLPNSRLPQVRIEAVAGGTPVLRMHGRTEATCVLEVSSDLNTWQAISTNTAAPGGVMVYENQAGATPARFYRAREQ